jgi:hypothetical protein
VKDYVGAVIMTLIAVFALIIAGLLGAAILTDDAKRDCDNFGKVELKGEFYTCQKVGR